MSRHVHALAVWRSYQWIFGTKDEARIRDVDGRGMEGRRSFRTEWVIFGAEKFHKLVRHQCQWGAGAHWVEEDIYFIFQVHSRQHAAACKPFRRLCGHRLQIAAERWKILWLQSFYDVGCVYPDRELQPFIDRVPHLLLHNNKSRKRLSCHPPSAAERYCLCCVGSMFGFAAGVARGGRCLLVKPDMLWFLFVFVSLLVVCCVCLLHAL